MSDFELHPVTLAGAKAQAEIAELDLTFAAAMKAAYESGSGVEVIDEMRAELQRAHDQLKRIFTEVK